jgi:hypothetical protein
MEKEIVKAKAEYAEAYNSHKKAIKDQRAKEKLELEKAKPEKPVENPPTPPVPVPEPVPEPVEEPIPEPVSLLEPILEPTPTPEPNSDPVVKTQIQDLNHDTTLDYLEWLSPDLNPSRKTYH